MDHLAARGSLVKRGLSKGGIAGVVVGVIVGVALVALCLYPFVIRRIRRRKQLAPGVCDPETGEVPTSGGTAVDDQRHVSSQDSFKPSRELTRGGVEEGSVKDLPWVPHDGLTQPNGQAQAPAHPGYAPRLNTNLPPTFGPSDVQAANESIPRSTPFDTYNGEYMPQSIGDAHNGVLSGTSADYYSPSIPSEVFGMFATQEPEPLPQPQRTLSSGSSLRHNLKLMFSRKSTRDQSMNSPTSLSLAEDPENAHNLPQSTHDAPLQRITTAGDPTESPTDITPPAGESLPAASGQTLGSPIALPSTLPKGAVQTPPDSPPTTSAIKFHASPSPPTHPAPGTVNPMDIMPASTESEVWHRTDYQMYMAQSSPNPGPLPETTPLPEDQSHREEPTDSPSPLTLPPNNPQPLPIIQSPTPTQNESSLKQEHAEAQDILMDDIPSHSHLSPLPDFNSRHASYPSDASTPQPGPTSTNPSTLNTPATQLDTPSPNSVATSSDYQHSVSPRNGATNVSPGNGVYACDTPGCLRVFDQPHKLK
ncbi:hypothetical protein ACHAPT_000686 [Fusarium lateritium]